MYNIIYIYIYAYIINHNKQRDLRMLVLKDRMYRKVVEISIFVLTNLS